MFEVSKLSVNYKCENFAFKNAADSIFLPKTDLARFALKASHDIIWVHSMGLSRAETTTPWPDWNQPKERSYRDKTWYICTVH